MCPFRACVESTLGTKSELRKALAFLCLRFFIQLRCEWTDMVDIENQTNLMTLLHHLGMLMSEAVLKAFSRPRCSKKSSNTGTT